MVGFDFKKLNTDKREEQGNYRFNVEDVRALKIDTESDDIRVQIGGDEVVVECWNGKRSYYEVAVEDGTLNVIYKSKSRFSIGLNFPPACELTVTIPESLVLGDVDVSGISSKIHAAELYAESAKYSSVSGDISLEGLEVSKEMSVSTTSGKLLLNDMKVGENTSIKSVSGNMTLSDADLSGKLDIKTTSGKLVLTNVDCADDVELKAVSDNIAITHGKLAGDMEIKTTSAKVKFASLKVDGDVNIGTVSGNVSGELIGKEGDFTFEAHTVSGNIKVPSGMSADKKCAISTTSGNISLSYTQN